MFEEDEFKITVVEDDEVLWRLKAMESGGIVSGPGVCASLEVCLSFTSYKLLEKERLGGLLLLFGPVSSFFLVPGP